MYFISVLSSNSNLSLLSLFSLLETYIYEPGTKITLLLYQVCHVGANFPCKPEQIHWNTTVGKRPKCFDCPDCLPGSEPSVLCGTSVNDWPDIHCVSCKLGKTFSDEYDTSQCKACTICSKGKAVKNNCTLTTNTICDSKCGPRFYNVRLISNCLPCAQCCDDGKDELAAECAKDKNKCKVRSPPCNIIVQTTPSKLSERNSNISNTLPTTQTVTLESDTPAMNDNEQEEWVPDEISISITPTPALDYKESATERVVPEKQDWTTIVVILLIIVLALCAVMSVLVIVKKIIRVRDMLRSSEEQNSENRGKALPRPHSSASDQSSQESASPLLNRRSESPQPSGSELPQPSGSELPQPSGSELPQPSASELPQLSGSESPRPNGCESTQPNVYESPRANESPPSQLSGVKSPKPLNNLTLEQLEEKHLSMYEWMCKELNNRKPGNRWDFERLASCCDKFTLTDRNSLKNELESDRGSPSDVLMSYIKTKYPDHSVCQLVRNLESIGRNDIASRLMSYIEQKSSPTQEH